MRRDLYTGLIVALIMIVGILGITNPGYKQTYQVFENVEGKVVHNYFIFSIYRQYNGYSETPDKEYREYRQYVGIAMNFFEISPKKEKIE